jgi:hypothetical protein
LGECGYPAGIDFAYYGKFSATNPDLRLKTGAYTIRQLKKQSIQII